jgi:hypothetical protein
MAEEMGRIREALRCLIAHPWQAGKVRDGRRVRAADGALESDRRLERHASAPYRQCADVQNEDASSVARTRIFGRSVRRHCSDGVIVCPGVGTPERDRPGRPDYRASGERDPHGSSDSTGSLYFPRTRRIGTASNLSGRISNDLRNGLLRLPHSVGSTGALRQ